VEIETLLAIRAAILPPNHARAIHRFLNWCVRDGWHGRAEFN